MRLETERLWIRPVQGDDCEDLFALYSDPEVMRFTTGGVRNRAQTKDRLVQVITHWKQHGFGILALILKEKGCFIGTCGFGYMHNQRDVELAYRLARPFWGQGLATEAASRVVRHAFEDLRMPRVIATARLDNVAPQAVLRKLGMTYKQPYQYDGHEAVMYEIENPLIATAERTDDGDD
jgi:ribosomal-protein-alanine N-acetyltransferase